MYPLVLQTPLIAITGSSGKTTVREFTASIMERKWKVLKTVANWNLPQHTKKTVDSYDPSYQAVILELGMGKPGAGAKHCSYMKPNVSIITNVGRAHYGNLGNSVISTAKYKSVLIKNMDPNGMLLLNNDDENSKLLETEQFNGQIITVGINTNADYQATNIIHSEEGMRFQLTLDGNLETFFIPIFGVHNIYNALFAIALCHRLQFSVSDIKIGLKKYNVPIKRLNFYQLRDQSILVDDTVNANPDSTKAAIEVLMQKGKDKKKILVLGSMLELGDYTIEGHKEVGQYLAQNNIDRVYTLGEEGKWTKLGAIQAGFPAEKIRCFQTRNRLHRVLRNFIEPNTIILIKGSSSMKMGETVSFIKNRYMHNIIIDNSQPKTQIRLCQKTYNEMRFTNNIIFLHFGAFTKELSIVLDEALTPGDVVLPQSLTKKLSIPDLPYEYYFENNHLFLGPVIGLCVYPTYMREPKKQLLRFVNYEKIHGLIFLFRQNAAKKAAKTIQGYYYDPKTNDFLPGTFPYPSAIFNRVPLSNKKYDNLKKRIGNNIFNHPYSNIDKLAFWQQLSTQEGIGNHLPETAEYKDVSSLMRMITKYSSLYLKPTTTAGGTGIIQVQANQDSYVLKDGFGEKFFLNSIEELSTLLSERLLPKKGYIIQQDIPFLNSNGEKIDFRLYIQKGQDKKWRFSGLETKVAKLGSIISNSKNRERIVPGENALMEFFGLNAEEANQKIADMYELCLKVLGIMENDSNHFGDVAFDLILDQNQKIWLLEAQVNYAAEIKARRSLDEQTLLLQILPTPLEYAKALTKF